MMYLLLRDNKQSGPYSLDDLKTKGLKAYDLVWVEGKSAAWRYPSEINELSAFAPAVEEQPFDRFYKKPAAGVVGSAAGSAGSGAGSAVGSGTGFSSGGASTTAASVAAAYQPRYPEEQVPATRKRTIYVTMPGAAATPVTVRETIRTAPAVRPTAAALPVEDHTFSEPVSRLDNRRNDHNGELIHRARTRNKPAILQPILIGVGVLVLLAGGIFIGLSINKDNPVLQKFAFTHTTATPLPVPSAVSPSISTAGTATQPQSTDPVATTQDRDHAGAGAVSTPGSASGSTPVSGPVSLPAPTHLTQSVSGKTEKAVEPRQKAIMPASQALPSTITKDSSWAAGGVAIVHREAVHRTDAPSTDAGSLKVNLASQVAIGVNKYEVGTFGGISNLQVTVSNKSAYPLDLVVVEVQYIQANRKTYKTENLNFHNVGPGITLMQEAPKSSRGIKVEYRITQISSRELGVSESGL